MGIFNPGTGTGRGNPRGRAQRLDMLIGILGFFTFMALLQAVILELRGDEAAGAALLLLALVVVLALVVQRRRSLHR